jgi:hypothetical protein
VKTKINKKVFDWDAHSSAINEIWKEEHEGLMATLEETWRGFADQWLASEAGKGFQTMLDASKYDPFILSSDPDNRASKARKDELDASCLEAYEYRAPRAEPKSYKGIPWGINQIYQCFRFLHNVTDVESFRVNSKGQYERPGSADPQDEDDEDEWDENDLWFSADIPEVMKRTNDSWLCRLGAAASGVIVQIIYIVKRYADQNGKPVTMSSQAVRDLILRSPTLPIADGTWPPFPCSTGPLRDWVAIFQDKHRDDASSDAPGSPSEVEFMGANMGANKMFKTELERITEGRLADLDRGEIQGSAGIGLGMLHARHEAAVMQYESQGGDPSEFGGFDILTPLSFPPAPRYPRQLTEEETYFIDANFEGKCSIMWNLMDKELKRAIIIRDEADNRITFLQEKMDEFTKEVTTYKELKKELDTKVVAFGQLTADVKNQEDQAKTYRRDTLLRQKYDFLLQRQQLHQSRASTSPYETPKSGFAYILHCIRVR